jgi:class 3 adenylate cyclase
MLVCPSCGQDNPEIAKFCLACGAALAEPEPAPEEERKVVTALFTDIVGSTASAEQMDPEDVRARLAPYYARVRTELESFGGQWRSSSATRSSRSSARPWRTRTIPSAPSGRARRPGGKMFKATTA